MSKRSFKTAVGMNKTAKFVEKFYTAVRFNIFGWK